MKRIFKNKPNELIKVDNKEYWISRSVAVVGLLLFKTNNETYVLLELRSEIMDSPNLWCLPCGYIDYSETGWECLLREVYEETGFDITENEEFIIYDNNKQPYFVNTDPSENRQNIALRYGVIFNDFLPHVQDYKNDEITKISLVNIKNIDNYQFAFNHDKVIKNFIEIC
jgi:8-oxo-dGTP pyrophosphatase MutT (NUDIX family)